MKRRRRKPARWLMHHAKGALASPPSPAPWPHMLICGCAAAVPTAAGLVHGELNLAIYGGLAGYLMALNDHFGALAHRLLVATVSFAALVASFALGLTLRDDPVAFGIVMAVLTYGLGLMGGAGAEVERLLLFSLIDLVVIAFATFVTPDAGARVLPYGMIALVTVLAGQVWSDRFARPYRSPTYAKLRPSLKSAWTASLARHRHALRYTGAVSAAIALVRAYDIERGYWMIVTVLLVMRPNLRESLYRHVQRLVGTVLGVLIGDALILAVDTKVLLLLGVFAAAFGVPYAQRRNYWLVSFFATILVVMFLTLPATGPTTDVHVPFVRLLATLYGCGLSAVITLASFAVERVIAPRRGAEHA